MVFQQQDRKSLTPYEKWIILLNVKGRTDLQQNVSRANQDSRLSRAFLSLSPHNHKSYTCNLRQTENSRASEDCDKKSDDYFRIARSQKGMSRLLTIENDKKSTKRIDSSPLADLKGDIKRVQRKIEEIKFLMSQKRRKPQKDAVKEQSDMSDLQISQICQSDILDSWQSQELSTERAKLDSERSQSSRVESPLAKNRPKVYCISQLKKTPVQRVRRQGLRLYSRFANEVCPSVSQNDNLKIPFELPQSCKQSPLSQLSPTFLIDIQQTFLLTKDTHKNSLINNSSQNDSQSCQKAIRPFSETFLELLASRGQVIGLVRGDKAKTEKVSSCIGPYIKYFDSIIALGSGRNSNLCRLANWMDFQNSTQTSSFSLSSAVTFQSPGRISYLHKTMGFPTVGRLQKPAIFLLDRQASSPIIVRLAAWRGEEDDLVLKVLANQWGEATKDNSKKTSTNASNFIEESIASMSRSCSASSFAGPF